MNSTFLSILSLYSLCRTHVTTVFLVLPNFHLLDYFVIAFAGNVVLSVNKL